MPKCYLHMVGRAKDGEMVETNSIPPYYYFPWPIFGPHHFVPSTFILDSGPDFKQLTYKLHIQVGNVARYRFHC